MSKADAQLGSLQLYGRLLGYIRPYWKVIVVAFVATQIAAVTEPLFAWLLGPLININFGAHSSKALPGALQYLADHLHLSSFASPGKVSPLLIPSLIVLLFLIRGISTFFSDFFATWLSNRLVTDLREKMFERVLTLPVAYYDEHPSGHLMSRISGDVTSVTGAGLSILTVVVKDSVTVIAQLGLMIYIDWRLTLITLAILPLTGFSIRAAGKRLRGLNRDQQHAMRELTQVLQESIQNQRVVKIFGGKDFELSRFQKAANRVRQLAVKQTAASSANSALVQFLIAVALAIVIYYASIRSAAGAMSAGDFMSFLTAMLMLSQPVQRLTRVNESLQKGLAAAESVFGLMDEKPESDIGTQTTENKSLSVRFENLSFQYNRAEKHALHQLNIEIKAGETVALVGSSGSGKTTLAQLLPRFYEPAAGCIYINNVPATQLSLSSLRAAIALVSQDVMLFNDTVAANIAYGMTREVLREEIEAAAEAAYALDFIEALPEGFDTEIGERGTRLSGGQKQRLAVARALLKDAPILILDEATSALDTESERQVQKALERLMQNRTTLVIAHRLSTIERADRILVMSHGQIVEAGSHKELLAHDGAYARLWQMQFREEGKN
ncbi:lipid A export permease/ATP-binding protein MsbA [Leeia oryzae]|uniref:lipid A export permease/ATP-binding protein MsbA n=1 Tax=Leeia oryzae TaxID=356662 RepID=UPI00036E5B34|nr:lipid A export permease/ATP-binding protein MsbA [Leeia oryzae]